MKLLTNYLLNTDYDNAITNEDVCYPNTSFIQETSALYILNDKVDYSTQYFNLTPHEDANITIIPSGSTFFWNGEYMYISYSIDNCETWNQVPTDTNATVSVKAGEKIYLKASVYNHHSWSGPAQNQKIYTCDKQYKIAGNILSLLYEDDFLGDDIIAQVTLSGYFANDTNLVDARNLYLSSNMEDYAYAGMFKGCTSLISAPKLKATTLAMNCYDSMFYGCTSLTTAPELPATTLARQCYNQMFYGCTSLTSVPELPATTLAHRCYEYMFEQCISLVTAPELPATTLATDCYSSMFKGCTSLTSAPELPATTLASNCYGYMFMNCTSLTSAPELPATTLTNSCYYYMFSGCTSLVTAPQLPAATIMPYCYSNMFYECTKLSNITMLATNISERSGLDYWVDGVASTGTFTKHQSMTSLPTGASGIPEGWTVVDYAA